MQGPFIATVDIGSPFKMTSEPYTIAGPPAIEPEIIGKRNLWPIAIAVLCVAIAYVIFVSVRKSKSKTQ
ncbi:MAG: hypothetical protein MUO33_08945 [Sedimentisphaerales bacterium]|nr:hypothetical protein [Sedimentisphaerales bacterium]